MLSRSLFTDGREVQLIEQTSNHRSIKVDIALPSFKLLLLLLLLLSLLLLLLLSDSYLTLILLLPQHMHENLISLPRLVLKVHKDR